MAIPMESIAQSRSTVHQWLAVNFKQNGAGEDLAANDSGAGLPEFVHATTRNGSESTATMVLEKAVTYLHMPQNVLGSLAFDVRAEIPGGRITAYYPYAAVGKPGDPAITWKQATIGDAAEGPETDSATWLAPRAVSSAATIKVDRPRPGTQPGDVGTTEGEVYLYYQGESSATAPLQVTVVNDKLQLALRGANDDSASTTPVAASRVAAGWFIDLNPDGRIAFTRIESMSADSPRQETVALFTPDSYTEIGHDGVRAELREALFGEGLLNDEAGAMLQSLDEFLRRPGKAVLFLLPRDWLDNTLPLTLTGQAQLTTRLGLGRIDLEL